MNPCDKCKRPMDLKCCHNCKKDAAECDVWHKCGEDCKEWEAQIQTNADRIRAMSDEELVKWVSDGCPPGEHKCNGVACYDCWMQWLKQPVEVDNG